MSTSAERTYSDAISNATYDLAKAKEALTLALNYFTNCEHYDHVEAMTDITMNGFSTEYSGAAEPRFRRVVSHSSGHR